MRSTLTLAFLLLFAAGASAATCDDLDSSAESLAALALDEERVSTLSETEIDRLARSARNLDRAASALASDPHVGAEAKQLAAELARASRELGASLPLRECGRLVAAYDGVVERLGPLESWCTERSIAGFRSTPRPPPTLTGKGATRGIRGSLEREPSPAEAPPAETAAEPAR